MLGNVELTLSTLLTADSRMPFTGAIHRRYRNHDKLESGKVEGFAMNTEEILATGQEKVMNTYGRLPMALVKGQGTLVWDSDGKRYLDFVTGLAVTSLGHSHPEIVETIRQQAGEILHSSNLYWIPGQVKLAKLLTDHSFAAKAFFCNSGAEAMRCNQTGPEIRKEYYGSEKYKIVSLKNSFHGGFATLTATVSKYQEGYEPCRKASPI